MRHIPARLTAKNYALCPALREARERGRLAVAGLILIRQMPGAAKGVMFITLEDESAKANLVVWPAVLAKFRRTNLSASVPSCRGKVQKANGVIHLIIEQVDDLSADLKRTSGLEGAFPLRAGQGDKAWATAAARIVASHHHR